VAAYQVILSGSGEGPSPHQRHVLELAYVDMKNQEAVERVKSISEPDVNPSPRQPLKRDEMKNSGGAVTSRTLGKREGGQFYLR